MVREAGDCWKGWGGGVRRWDEEALKWEGARGGEDTRRSGSDSWMAPWPMA